MLIGFGISPSRVKVTGGAAFDADAQAFFTAASITDNTQKSAVNQLVLDLKSYGIWTKCLAIYPICGGSASSHAINLKTPGTYNLTFATGWTHASTGMTPANAYADTAIIPSSVLTTNNNHISYYSRTNIGETGICMGCSDGATEVPIMYLNARNTSNVAQFYNQDTAAGTFVNASNTDSRGFFVSNRTANNVMKGFKNGSQIGTTGTTTTTRLLPSTRTIVLGAYNYAVGSPFIVGYGTKQCAFASIGDGLTDTEAANFYTAVQAYQTTLSRNV